MYNIIIVFSIDFGSFIVNSVGLKYFVNKDLASDLFIDDNFDDSFVVVVLSYLFF